MLKADEAVVNIDNLLSTKQFRWQMQKKNDTDVKELLVL